MEILICAEHFDIFTEQERFQQCSLLQLDRFEKLFYGAQFLGNSTSKHRSMLRCIGGLL